MKLVVCDLLNWSCHDHKHKSGQARGEHGGFDWEQFRATGAIVVAVEAQGKVARVN